MNSGLALVNRSLRVVADPDVPFTVPSLSVYAPRDEPVPLEELAENVPRDLQASLIQAHCHVSYALNDPDDEARFPPPSLRRGSSRRAMSDKGPVEVRLTERISWYTSRTWHVYRATVSCDGQAYHVIAKVLSPAMCIDDSVVPHVFYGGQALERALNEDIIYTERLKQKPGKDATGPGPLEGAVVPMWHGLFVDEQHLDDPSRARLVVALVDDAGPQRLSGGLPWHGTAQIYRPKVTELLRRLYCEAGIFKVDAPWDAYNVFGLRADGKGGDRDDLVAAVRIACFGRWIVRCAPPDWGPDQMRIEGQADFDKEVRPYMEDESVVDRRRRPR